MRPALLRLGRKWRRLKATNVLNLAFDRHQFCLERQNIDLCHEPLLNLAHFAYFQNPARVLDLKIRFSKPLASG